MLTTVVIIAVVIAIIIGVITVRNKAKGDPNYKSNSARPDAPPGYNARANDPAVRGTGRDQNESNS